MDDLQKLLAKRGRFPTKTDNNHEIMKQPAKKTKPSCELKVVLLSVRQFSDGSGDCKLSLLVFGEGLKKAPCGSVIMASLGREMKKNQQSTLLSFHPGMLMTCEISYMEGTSRTFYDLEKILEKEIAPMSVYSKDAFVEQMTLPVNSKDIPQYDILIPLTKDFTDLSSKHLSDSLEEANGFWIDVEKTSMTDNTYGFKRVFKVGLSQWIDSRAEDAVKNCFCLNIVENALGCFGITNKTHWEDDEYANKWLFETEYTVRAYLTKKSKETLSKIEKGFPEKIYIYVTDLLTDLPGQVKKLGKECDVSQVEALVARFPGKIDRASFANNNRYSKDPETKIVNVGECPTHVINHDQWQYYVVSKDESMSSIFDLFAIKKES